jgi:predicted NBD/HSP70 family sugar kinase
VTYKRDGLPSETKVLILFFLKISPFVSFLLEYPTALNLYNMTRGGPCRIGVDVGGTNTDAAIIEISASETESRGVRASSKTPTTVDVTSGIHTVIEDVLSKSSVDRRDILSVAIGTTHFVNAVVEADARRLSRVAVIRLCGPFTKMVNTSVLRN